MSLIRRLARDPLAHFALLGAALFGVYSLVNENDMLEASERVIEVDRATLVNFLQYRSAAFEPAYFEARYDAMNDQQRAELARSYIREEAMAREAAALSLDQNDYVIRRRLIQKIEYLVTDTDLDPTPPTENELQAYFAEHRNEFTEAAEFTFTHVFADAEREHTQGLEGYANALLASLRSAGAQFNDAPSYGDRFPYQRNYVRQDLRPIAQVFGPEFAAELARLQPADEWQGPILSTFGYHLVMLTDQREARVPDFAEVRDQVLAAVIEERQADTREALLNELVEQYDVRYDDPALAPSRAGRETG